MEEIKVKIKKNGTVEMNCNGFIGEACNVTKVAEEALGLVTDYKDKDDLYKNEIQNNQLNYDG